MTQNERQQRIVDRAMKNVPYEPADPRYRDAVENLIQLQRDAVADIANHDTNIVWLHSIDQGGEQGSEPVIYDAIGDLEPARAPHRELITYQLAAPHEANISGLARTVDGRLYVVFEGSRLRLVAAVVRDARNYTQGVLIRRANEQPSHEG